MWGVKCLFHNSAIIILFPPLSSKNWMIEEQNVQFLKNAPQFKYHDLKTAPFLKTLSLNIVPCLRLDNNLCRAILWLLTMTQYPTVVRWEGDGGIYKRVIRFNKQYTEVHQICWLWQITSDQVCHCANKREKDPINMNSVSQSKACFFSCAFY